MAPRVGEIAYYITESGIGLPRCGKCEEKCRALSLVALYPNPAPMDFYDPLHEREPHSGAFGFNIQFVKEPENSFEMFRRDPNTVVLYIKDRFAIFFATLADLDGWVGLVAHIFCSIIDQVLQYLHQTRLVTIYRWKIRINMDGNRIGFNAPVEDFHGFMYKFTESHGAG